MGTIYWIGLIILLLAFLDWLRVKIRRRKYLVGVTTPTYVPFIGNILEIGTFRTLPYILGKMRLMYGTMFLVNLAFLEYLVVCDSKWIEIITTSQKFLKKSTDYNLLHNWLGDGLLTSTGDKWRKARKFLTPAFHFNNLDQFIKCFNKNSDQLINKLEGHVGKQIDLYPFISLCTLDTICEAIMGANPNAQTKENSKYVQSVAYMSDIVFRRAITIWKTIDFLYYFTSDYRQEKRALKILHDTTYSVINKRRKFLMENPDITTNNKGKCTFFLDMLLLGTIDGKPLTDLEIREQVDTFMFEGHDTTSSAICFSLITIAKYPDIQEKIVDEIKRVVGDNKDLHLTHENLLNLKYLSCVVKECLRLYTPVPVFGRTLQEDVTLDGVLFPKGLSVLLAPALTHRDDDYFKDPELIKPERFADKNWNGGDPYKYIPFSAGFRNCIGKKFAILEVHSVVAKIVRRFKLKVPDGYLPIFKTSMVLKTKNGFPVTLEERD